VTRFCGDDYDYEFPNQGELWSANVQRHLKGAKGQAILRELRDALLALPKKKLINGRLADEQGCVCTVGALAAHRGVSLKELAEIIKPDERWGEIDAWEAEVRTMDLGRRIGLKEVMAVTLAARNDDVWLAPVDETDEQRYIRVLAWVESQITPELVTA